jgi:predicted nucleotidyltransferase
MLSIDEAFRKFKSRLELNEREQKNASQRQNEVRDYLQTKFGIARSFLTGSYARYTKTKPLKDIDIFFVLKDSEKHYHGKAASVVLDDFHSALVEKYGSAAVRKQARSINVDFGVHIDAEDNTDYRVVSVDAVPAFDTGDQYEIPDTASGKWIKTDPEIHKDKATAAHQAYGNEWKGLVRMVKYWNNNPKHGDQKPVKPSFLIEVMALECLYGGWGGSFDREIQSFFATLADRVHDEWPDPPASGRRSATTWTLRASSARSSCCPSEPGRKCRHRPRASRSQYRSASSLARAVWPQVPAVLIPSASIRPIEVQHVPVVAFPAPVVPARGHPAALVRSTQDLRSPGHEGGCERERLDRHAGYLSAQTVPGGQGACGGQPGELQPADRCGGV